MFLPFQFAGTVVPGSGTLLNGINADGRKQNGNYYDYPRALFGPRVSFAWDIHGDHKAALRGAYTTPQPVRWSSVCEAPVGQ